MPGVEIFARVGADSLIPSSRQTVSESRVVESCGWHDQNPPLSTSLGIYPKVGPYVSNLFRYQNCQVLLGSGQAARLIHLTGFVVAALLNDALANLEHPNSITEML